MSHQTIIIALPPKDIQDRLAKIVHNYEEQFGEAHASSLPAHITIVAPFPDDLNAAEVKWIENFPLRAPVNLMGYDCFNRRNGILYLRCASPVLKTVRQQLIEHVPGLTGLNETDSIFHLTIARRVPDDKLAEVLKAMPNHDKGFGTFYITKLEVYTQKSPDSQWVECTV